MENQEEFIVAGYHFKSKEAAEKAKDEVNAIKYLSEKTDAKDARNVYALYNKLLDTDLFKTLVGLNYLRELQDILYKSKDIPNEKIRPIPVQFEVQEFLDGRRQITKNKGQIRTLEQKCSHYKDWFVRSMIVNAALLVIILVIILITRNSSNPNILNYEVNLQNKYAGWSSSNPRKNL